MLNFVLYICIVEIAENFETDYNIWIQIFYLLCQSKVLICMCGTV